MQAEQARVVNTETEWERVSVMVKEAFNLWSQDSTSAEAAGKMNYALNEAYGTGVRISIEVEQQALDSPKVVNQEKYDELKKLDPWMQNRIVINSVQDNPRFSRIYRGQVMAANGTGFLSLDVLIGDRSENLALLKPDDIVSFTPVSITR